MAIEIEKKFVLNDEQREKILIKLKEFDADFIAEVFEENILYNNKYLNSKSAILRVRKTSDKTILTYKQRVDSQSSYKQHIEFETEVKNADEAENIIESIGLEKVLVYEKRRQIWKFRAVELVIDQLPFGLYMEIEGLITAIAEVEMLLNIENLLVENETYPRLTQKYGVQNGNLIEARF